MNPDWIECLPKTPPETETEHHSEHQSEQEGIYIQYIYNDHESEDDESDDDAGDAGDADDAQNVIGDADDPDIDIINMEIPIHIKLNRVEIDSFHSKLYTYYASTRCSQESCAHRYEMLCLMNSIWQKVLISREVDKNQKNIAIMSEDIFEDHKYYKPYVDADNGLWVTPCFAPKKRLKLMDKHANVIIYDKAIPSASIFGSICTGLECDGSDLDITLPNSVDNPCIDIWFNKSEQKSKLSAFLNTLNDEIMKESDIVNKYKFEIFPVLNAKVPIIKMRELSLQLEMDIAIQSTQQSVANLINIYCDYDERVRPFIIAIKHWSKTRGLCDAMNNYPNSFGFVLLCIKFLQMVNIIPIYCINNNHIEMVHDIDTHNCDNNDTLLQLMVQFFEMYHRFNFKLLQISTSRSGLESKICHEFKYNHMHQSTMVVEDPSCRSVNVTRHVRPYRLSIMQNEFFRAYICCKNGDWDLLMANICNCNFNCVFNKYPPSDLDVDHQQLFYERNKTRNVV